MQPINGSVVVVGKSFANRSSRESLLVLAHMRFDDGGNLALLNDCAESPVMGAILEQFRSLVGLFEVRRHALQRALLERRLRQWYG